MLISVLKINLKNKYLQVRSVVSMKLLAYHSDNIRVANVDKPRNLAKSIKVK